MEREELERRVAAGESIRTIAQASGKSPTAVRHWLAKYGLRTRLATRRDVRASTVTTLELHCAHHGVTRFHRWSGRYRCGRCNSEAVARRRRRVKEILVQEHGGRCVACGYSRYLGALEFHHLDPGEKSFSLAHAGVSRSLSKARAEAAKCVLLCANCHAEVEAGIVEVATERRAACTA